MPNDTIRGLEIDTVCELCGKQHNQVLDIDGAGLPACPGCGATFADRALAATLMSHLSDAGCVRFSKFIEEKRARGLVFGSFGRAFTIPGVNADLADCSFRANLSDLVTRNGNVRKIPLRDNVLDALLLDGVAPLALGFAELKRVMRTGGLIVVSGGFRLPLPAGSSGLNPGAGVPSSEPPVVGEDFVALAREAGLLAYFDRPAAGYTVLEAHTLLIMIVLGS